MSKHVPRCFAIAKRRVRILPEELPLIFVPLDRVELVGSHVVAAGQRWRIANVHHLRHDDLRQLQRSDLLEICGEKTETENRVMNANGKHTYLLGWWDEMMCQSILMRLAGPINPLGCRTRTRVELYVFYTIYQLIVPNTLQFYFSKGQNSSSSAPSRCFQVLI